MTAPDPASWRDRWAGEQQQWWDPAPAAAPASADLRQAVAVARGTGEGVTAEATPDLRAAVRAARSDLHAAIRAAEEHR